MLLFRINRDPPLSDHKIRRWRFWTLVLVKTIHEKYTSLYRQFIRNREIRKKDNSSCWNKVQMPTTLSHSKRTWAIPKNRDMKKKWNSVFSIKDMHCRQVLTVLWSPIEWLTFCPNSSTCYYVLWKKTEFPFFEIPYFRVLPRTCSLHCWTQVWANARLAMRRLAFSWTEHRWVLLCLNVKNPNSQFIRSPMEISCRSLMW